MKIKILILFLLVLTLTLTAQVGIGTSSPDASSILDVESTTKGFLPPRLASDGDVSSPANGLVIYDESDDCLNVFNGSEWVNLCDAGNAGGGDNGGVNVPLAGQNDYSWATPLRFTQIMLPRVSNNSMVTATSTGGDAYVWGTETRQLIRNWQPTTGPGTDLTSSLPSSGFDKYLTSPQKLDDPAFSGKVKAFYNSDDLYAIFTTDGKVYTFGLGRKDLQSNGQDRSVYYVKSRLMTYPGQSLGKTITDFKLSRESYYIIESDGLAYFKGGFLGITGNSSWRQIAAPSPGVTYTEILNKSNPHTARLFLKGSDGNIYAVGNARGPIFGPNATSNTDPTVAAGITLMPFPAGVSQKIVKIKDQDNYAAAITNDGEIYAWGSYSSGATVSFKIDPSENPTIVGSSPGIIYEPTKVALPPGETSLLDIDFDYFGNFDQPTTLVGGSGKVYVIGGDDSQEFVFASSEAPSTDYAVSWSAERVVAKEVYMNQDVYAYLDAEGQYFHHGDIKGTGGYNRFYGNGAFTTPVAMPITDGNQDDTNPNP